MRVVFIDAVEGSVAVGHGAPPEWTEYLLVVFVASPEYSIAASVAVVMVVACSNLKSSPTPADVPQCVTD